MQERVQIPGESDDARAKRARDQLALAFVELIKQRDYDSISVQDIAEHAGVSRTTFYAHFQDKDDVMVRYNVVFGQMLGTHLSWDEASSQYRFPIAHLFEHVREFRALYDSLNRARRMQDLLKILRINMAEGFQSVILSRRGGHDETAASVVAHHIAASVLNLLIWWLDRHCQMDARRMEEEFHRLIVGLR